VGREATGLLELLSRWFGRESNSKEVAKERLRMVLVHDRASMSPQLWENLKEDLIRVISRYVEIDESAMEVQIQSESDAMALVANIPIRQLRRSGAQAASEN
jgi:cell division topological specificity factor